jgi:hypothetical protein
MKKASTKTSPPSCRSGTGGSAPCNLPDHWPKNYGTVNFQPPETYVGQLAYPFRRKGKATPYG